jgi:hypothetical protein
MPEGRRKMAMKFSGNASVFAELAECILGGGAYKATKYISPKLTVKATRRLKKGRIDKRDRTAEIVFTIGAPNYEEREFIKKAKKAKEAFPIEYIQMKWPK